MSDAELIRSASLPIVRIEQDGTRVIRISQGLPGPPGPPGEGATLSDAAPALLGMPAPGVSAEAARSDHVHQMPSAADVGADPAGAAAAAVATHEGAADPHPQYLTPDEADAAYEPIGGGANVMTRDAAGSAVYPTVPTDALHTYNVRTSESDNERLAITWDGNWGTIRTEKSGSGASRSLEISDGQSLGNYLRLKYFSGLDLSEKGTTVCRFSNSTQYVKDAFSLRWGVGITVGIDTELDRPSPGALRISDGGAGAGLLEKQAVALADLPLASAVNVGTEATITDASSTDYYSVAVGGGAFVVGVRSDGTQWRVVG